MKNNTRSSQFQAQASLVYITLISINRVPVKVFPWVFQNHDKDIRFLLDTLMTGVILAKTIAEENRFEYNSLVNM